MDELFALGSIMGLLGKPKPSEIYKSIDVLEACGDIYGLLSLLSSKDLDIVKKAMASLKRTGPAAVDPLVRLINEGDSGLQYKAAIILGDIGDNRALLPVIRLSYSRDIGVRSCACLSLGHFDDDRATNALIYRLADPCDDVRDSAAFALSGHGERFIMPLVSHYARSFQKSDEAGILVNHANKNGIFDAGVIERNVQCRRELELLQDGVIRLLNFAEPPLADAFIAALLMDNDTGDADLEIISLWGSKAVMPLIRLLQGEEEGVRVRAILALGQLADKTAIGPLEQLLEDGDPEIRNAAASALRRLMITVPMPVNMKREEVTTVMRTCEYCGISIDMTSSYCRACGALLIDTDHLLS